MAFLHILLSPVKMLYRQKFDWARVVSRRAERKCVTWYKTLQIEDTKVVTYLNRLSDFLWMMAREFEEDWTPSS